MHSKLIQCVAQVHKNWAIFYKQKAPQNTMQIDIHFTIHIYL